DRNRSHWSTSKTPSYTKSVSWQHHQKLAGIGFHWGFSDQSHFSTVFKQRFGMTPGEYRRKFR
ncbi:AraC family transcriptional regulator, partial [Escherichia coli]|nr:AraC family transcriptional regulator [Escherichia coli]